MRALPLAMLLVCVLTGCGHSQPYVNDQRLGRGLVIVLPGIEGRSYLNEAICRGLDEGGVDCAIELVDWTSWWGPLIGAPYNLRAEARNRRKAAEIAGKVLRYKMSHPGRPVVLVGQSGGGAIALWIAEALPADYSVDGIVVLAAALSPTYPLDMALGSSRRGIVSFHSGRDRLLLGLGTTVFGTMDGEHTSSAGRVGFDVPNGPTRPAVYDRLFQIAWNKEMSSTGNTGMHLTSGSSEFIAEYVAPFVRSETWDEGLINRVLSHMWHQAPDASSQPTSQRETKLPPARTYRIVGPPGDPGVPEKRTSPNGR